MHADTGHSHTHSPRRTVFLFSCPIGKCWVKREWRERMKRGLYCTGRQMFKNTRQFQPCVWLYLPCISSSRYNIHTPIEKRRERIYNNNTQQLYMYKQIAFLVFLLLLLFFKFLFLYLFLSQLGYILPWSVSHQRVGLTLQQASDLLLLLLLFFPFVFSSSSFFVVVVLFTAWDHAPSAYWFRRNIRRCSCYTLAIYIICDTLCVCVCLFLDGSFDLFTSFLATDRSRTIYPSSSRVEYVPSITIEWVCINIDKV